MLSRNPIRVVAILLLAAGFCVTAGRAQEGTIQGQVIDVETQTPVPRANVVLWRNGARIGATTDTTGAFQVRVAPGEYRVEVSVLGYRPRERSVTVRSRETTRLSLSLAPQSYSLNEIVVEDRRGQFSQSTSTVQRVQPQSIEQQDAADVSELAPLMPATHVQTNSRGQTILYFRNAGDRQVGQFFDGALLNIPWDNRVDISLIPASVVEEITVTKGVPSVRYGANVLGGAINFQSRTLDSPGQTTELQGALGTAEQRRASVAHLGRTERWDYTAAVQYSGRGNQPLARNANLENNQPFDDRRVNTDRRLVSGFGRASYRFEGGGQLGLSVLHVDAEQGVAPEGNEANPGDTRYWRYPLWQKSTVIVSGRTAIGTNTSVQGAAWGSRFAQDIADYQSVRYNERNQTQEDRDLTAGARFVGTKRLSHGTLTLALNGLTSRHRKGTVPGGRTDAKPDSTTTFQQHIFSAGLEYETQLHPRIEASAGVNLDGADYPQTGPFPERAPFYAWGATSGLRVDLNGGWSLRGAVGRKSRFPTMRELFGAALGKFVPNPDLKPVTAWIGEVGIQRQAGSWSLEAAPFFSRVFDTIDKRTFEEGPNAGKEQRINLRGARIYGLETRGRWTPIDGLAVDGNLTWSRPRSFTDEGTQKLDEKPGWLGTGAVTYEFSFGLSIRGQVRYTGSTYARNQDNRFVPLPSSLIIDTRVRYGLGSVLGPADGSVYVRADNVTDDAKFIGLGLPGPGRSFRVGVQVTL